MDSPLIILAGGASSRIGCLTSMIPKAALCAYDEPILLRNVRDAIRGGFKHIFISTQPAYIRAFEEALLPTRYDPNATVRIVANSKHTYGPLPALLEILKHVDSKRVVVTLSDIFFLDRSYELLFANFATSEENILGVAVPFDAQELMLGGIVLIDGHKVSKIIEKPHKGLVKGLRWSGAVVMS